MKTWQAKDAKARFGELLATCVAKGPQLIIKDGAETAVLMSVAEWRRLRDPVRPTLKELLLATEPRIEWSIPQRGKARRRPQLP